MKKLKLLLFERAIELRDMDMDRLSRVHQKEGRCCRCGGMVHVACTVGLLEIRCKGCKIFLEFATGYRNGAIYLSLKGLEDGAQGLEELCVILVDICRRERIENWIYVNQDERLKFDVSHDRDRVVFL